MKNALYTVVAIALIIGGFFAFNNYIYHEKQGDGSEEEPGMLAEYFSQQMFAKATENGLIPIEGFDAQLLMGAYPGLIPEDFEGVQSFEGIYHVENGELVHARTQAEPVSSAATTVSKEGYGTLLENLSARLNFPIYNESNIDTLIEQIQGNNR